MQLKLLALAALQGFAAAQTTVFSSQVCVTSTGRVSVSPIRRTTITSFTGLTFRTTVCPAPRTATTTVTPPFVTTTSTVSVTAFSTVTTVQLTVTVFNTVTVTSTATTGSTSTVTQTTTSTVTQPPPPGFTALSDEPDYVAKKKKKRSLAGRIPLLKRAPCTKKKSRTGSGSDSGSGSSPDSGSNSNLNPIRIAQRRYPQSVRCFKIVKTVSVSTVVPATCVRARSTTVTLATSTSTALTTATAVVTTTVTVPTATAVTVTVSPTVTGQTTVTATVTTTTTATTTITETAPAQTVYAACGASNQVSSANGGHQFSAINVNSPGGQNQVFSRTANSAYDCCVSCLQTNNCIFSYYDNAGGCEVVVGQTCNPQDAMGTSFETSQDGGLNYVLSNGPCGRVANGGDQ
ncbi:uncharacterized protein NECHADRAFT_82969 [Fusarium vanettenii 77-13-4]|uniref:Apple domain-containing protein n=1 Tax=Fusarium vanettenii (strain ATCC MYA-4622 / CBS 123669 / FGSC 9596 / NRRL 45880 / 77-13-4) TaxID=660122 RepID=C7ZAT0_FUSV7|nr:uncharacterized protein NECHADRAFT_82969 [Fusarium vanettenii 77-13-4]EEU38626.1 predicted protein [Fusarium vanettenii 77-13-4]